MKKLICVEQVGKQHNEKRRDCEFCAMRHSNGRVIGCGRKSFMRSKEEREWRKKVVVLVPSLSSDLDYKRTDQEVNEQFLIISGTYFVLKVVIRTRVSSKIRKIQLFLVCVIYFRVPSPVRPVQSRWRYEFNLIHWLH